jgi:putative sugar O-methyltransferase
VSKQFGLRRRAAGFLRVVAGNPELRGALRRRELLIKGRLNRLLGRGVSKDDVRVYERMKEENRSSGELYVAGRFWERLNRQHANAIWGGGLANLRNEYFNRTFSGPEPGSRQVYRALLFLYYKHVRQLDVDGFLETNEDPAVGGTFDQETLFGRRCSLDFLQSVEEAYRIRDSWVKAGRVGAPRVIVELGAGYGRLAYVCRKLMPDCSYVILDLPEALICAQSWLRRVLGTDIVPYESTRAATQLGREQLAGGKVFFLLPHKIEQLKQDCADVFVNIYSFAEMPPPAIANYFRHLDRITDGIFYTKQRQFELNEFDGVSVSEESYPVPARWRLLFRSASTLYEHFFEAAYSTRGGGRD